MFLFCPHLAGVLGQLLLVLPDFMKLFGEDRRVAAQLRESTRFTDKLVYLSSDLGEPLF